VPQPFSLLGVHLAGAAVLTFVALIVMRETKNASLDSVEAPVLG
jgi:hypothetical protein